MTRKKQIRETKKIFVSGGRTDWKVRCNGSGYLVALAVAELKKYFALATGAELQEDANAQKYIWLGTFDEARKTGVLSAPATDNGTDFIIETVGDCYYICGASPYGVLYGVYEFLNVYFEFEPLAEDEVYYVSVGKADFKQISIADGADIEWRIANYGQVAKPSPTSDAFVPFRRLRLNHFDDALMKPGGYFCHNYCVVIKPEEYMREHPEWFSEGKFAGQQLCFSRDFDGLKDEVVKKMKEIILAHPDAGVLNFSQSDSAGWCECERCKKEKEKYCTDAAIAIKFLNACAREIKKWLSESVGGRKVVLSMFAYQSTEEAPVKCVDGKYVPIDDSVILEDNAVIFYAPCTADYYRDFYDPANKSAYELMKKWKVLSRQIHFWTYDLWGKSYLFPHYTFASKPGIFRFAKESDVSLYFNQGQFTQKTPTDFGRMKMYLDAKLGWDTSLDMNALVDNFLRKYYSDAAPAMRKFYDNYCAWHDYLIKNTDLRGECFSHESFYAMYYPEVVLESWAKNIAEALAAIEKYKDTDRALWEKLRDRIEVEHLNIRYMKIRFYGQRFTDRELWAEQEKFLADAERLGVTCMSESRAISHLREEWHISA